MRQKMALTLVFALSAGGASAQELTCWYDSDGNYKGADTGNYTGAPAQTVTATDFRPWAYVLSAEQYANGEFCPETITVPASAEDSSEAEK